MTYPKRTISPSADGKKTEGITANQHEQTAEKFPVNNCPAKEEVELRRARSFAPHPPFRQKVVRASIPDIAPATPAFHRPPPTWR
jgi:hypothetical protein